MGVPPEPQPRAWPRLCPSPGPVLASAEVCPGVFHKAVSNEFQEGLNKQIVAPWQFPEGEEAEHES